MPGFPWSQDPLPDPLQAEVDTLWQRWPEGEAPPELSPRAAEVVARVWGCSPFVAGFCLQRRQAWREAMEQGAWEKPLADAAAEMGKDLAARLASAEDETAWMRELRLFRHAQMARIAWRDLAGWATLQEVFRDLTALAGVCVTAAQRRAEQELAARFGTPRDESGAAMEWVILGMGKLGGGELNFSSDIDLIFTYPAGGETQGGRKSLDNQEYFTRLGQKVVTYLNQRTAEGFVFRVDMRLRPFGDSGPLALSFDAFEAYCQAHAREWERYALLKARPLTGSVELHRQLDDFLKPFIFRKYFDFGAFAALRDLKSQINQEVRRKSRAHDIKLGPGGIREIEFIAQLFQLIRGGREKNLQVRHLPDALVQLEQTGHLSMEQASVLRVAYAFLRRAENRLQAMEDQQTQCLPEDDLNRLRLAVAMEFDDWDTFTAELQYHRNAVQQEFSTVFSGHPEDAEAAESTARQAAPALVQAWQAVATAPENALETLTRLGFAEPEPALKRLTRLRKLQATGRLSRAGQERLDHVVPLMLDAIVRHGQCDLALARLLPLIEAIVRRSVYLALLIEHPQALDKVIQLCAASDWVAAQITRYPLLLDELLDSRKLYDILEPEALDNALHAQLAQVPLEDLEEQMDRLRTFKRAHVLRTAASELAGQITVEVASDYLTAVADCLLRQALSIAWRQLTERHGRPMCVEDGIPRPARFCIIGYGKAGGIEMSYASDLDIVFLHDSRGEGQQTDGEKPLDNNVFFARLVTRIIHLLATQTGAGMLYEVDPRLRPGGNSGLLVAAVEAFEKYQYEEAWTWEHQALVRARAITGDPEPMRAFERIRREVVGMPRDAEKLRQDIVEMRQKMRDSLDKTNAEQFDLKQGPGGITDIEFLVQYALLRWAGEHPDLLDTTGLLPMLQRLTDHGLYPAEDCAALATAYRTLRAETHRLALQSQSALAAPDAWQDLRDGARAVWRRVLE